MRTSRLFGLVVLALGLLTMPCAAGAQTPSNVRHVGVILLGGPYQATVDGLRQGLRELGLEEGKHFVLDVRDTQGDPKTVEPAAQALERAKVDLIYTVATSVTIAAKRATTQTPIVFFAGTDPIATSLVESFAKPGGRLTGIYGQNTEVTAKRLEILKQMVPKLRRVATFYNPTNPVAQEGSRLGREAARRLNVQFVERHVRSVEELRRALQELKPREVDAIFYTADAMVGSRADLIIDTAKVNKLPTMFQEYSMVAKGALASYGTNFQEIGRLSAKHVQRVLAGIPPKDLPVESYDRIEFALNLRTAREIGLAIPPSVRIQADRVVE